MNVSHLPKAKYVVVLTNETSVESTYVSNWDLALRFQFGSRHRLLAISFLKVTCALKD